MHLRRLYHAVLVAAEATSVRTLRLQAVEHVEAALRGLVALSEATWAPYKATLQQQQQHQQQAQPTAGSAPPAAHALEAPPVQVASRRVGAPPAAGALNPQLDPEAGTPHGLKDPQLDPEAGTPHGLKEDGWEAQQQGPAQLGGLRQQAGVPEASATRDVDSAMDATWACFRKIAEALADMPHEVFLGRLLGGRLDCFIPGTPFDPGEHGRDGQGVWAGCQRAERSCIRELLPASCPGARGPSRKPNQPRLVLICWVRAPAKVPQGAAPTSLQRRRRPCWRRCAPA
jgi:hypothetical protein